ncbi:HAMP domain-containing sensor histidine kinase [Sulfurimonas sp.]|uniref:sensor histidine kinase n=1 Tax=Sulfurimonas sp. TaxID=2022749 RepID=UPI0025D6E43E|nr:HAMP domain-containing sensor histidine kinase [Sulfurimonas sp.]
MHNKAKEIEFECLNSIGNTFELESVISEVMITYYRQTKAMYVSYSTKVDNENIFINIGVFYKTVFDIKKLEEKKCLTYIDNQYNIVILDLKIGYLTFVYKDRHADIDYLVSLISMFQQKINFAISACLGVLELENFNKELKNKIKQSIKKISKHEKLLLVKSKNILMGEMIEIITHQWRQPVTAIGLISNNVMLNMLLGELDMKILQEDLDGINKQVKYLSNTIDDFRDFFKEGKKEEVFILSDVIKNSIAILEKQFIESSIELTFENNCLDTKLTTFKSELMQALINIISNAKEAFSPDIKNRYLNISCNKGRKNVYIIISDNAGGIKNDIIEKIFDPYFSTKKQKNGTGLGLYICKIIICEHLKGDLRIKNKDNGATFIVTLPLIKESTNE